MAKVIHFITSLSRGGKERQLSTIVANTNFDKHPTSILYLYESKKTYINEYNLSNHSYRVEGKGYFRILINIHKFIKKEKPDIVFTWGNIESVLILLLNPFHRFKFINGSVRHGIRSKKISHFFRTLILHLSPFVVANSLAGLKANNLKRGMVLYNGISPKFIGKYNDNEKTARRETLIPITLGKFLFISVANMVPYKDYFSVLKALKELKNNDYNFYYLILGDGPLRSAIEKEIIHHGLEKNITILGNLENVNEYLRISDVFIHSSKGEGCSNAILEAMAAGLPVVATNTGGTSEILTQQNGLLFEYKNYTQLKKCLLVFIADDHTRKLAGQNSLRLIEKKYTIDRLINDYYNILNRVAEKNRY
jgi:glycosyltransferase involved in cell wall biosynthesis